MTITTTTFAFFLAIALVGGLVIVPAIVMEQQALADKGGIPHAGSHGKGRHHQNH
jgi:hypothetical protein